VRAVATAGDWLAGAVGSPTTISASGDGMAGVEKSRRTGALSHSGEKAPPSRRAVCRSAMGVRKPSGGHEARLGHQALVERVVLLEEGQHFLSCEEDGLQRLLFHVVLVLRRLRQLLEEIDIERRLVSRDFA